VVGAASSGSSCRFFLRSQLRLINRRKIVRGEQNLVQVVAANRVRLTGIGSFEQAFPLSSPGMEMRELEIVEVRGVKLKLPKRYERTKGSEELLGKSVERAGRAEGQALMSPAK